MMAAEAPAAPPASGPLSELAARLRRSGDSSRLIIVGAAPNIGATATAVSLARTLAERGRVVLVDLALAHPSIAAISTDPRAPGIADLVRGTASFRHIITRDRHTRMHLVATGSVTDDGTSILSSERLLIAINALARTYDHVVIDAGAMPKIPIDRFARLAPRAVLVAPGLPEEVAAAARERLIAAGFADVTMFVDPPPQPDQAASRAHTAAA